MHSVTRLKLADEELGEEVPDAAVPVPSASEHSLPPAAFARSLHVSASTKPHTQHMDLLSLLSEQTCMSVQSPCNTIRPQQSLEERQAHCKRAVKVYQYNRFGQLGLSPSLLMTLCEIRRPLKS